MSIADKLNTIAENEQKVYDAGYNAATDDMEMKMWKSITANGTRDVWVRTFNGTDYTGFSFPKPVKPVLANNNISYIERFCYEYKGTKLPGNIDLSNIPKNSTPSNLFSWSRQLVEIYDMGLPAINYDSCFTYCRSLKTIEVLRINETNTFPSFNETNVIKNIRIDGVIGKNVAISNCTLLTHDSLMSIINSLKDYSSDESGTAHSCSIGSTNLSKLTEEEQQIAIDKGWTLA